MPSPPILSSPTCVIVEVQELKHVAVPGLHVDGKGALSLASSLIYIPAWGGKGGDVMVRGYPDPHTCRVCSNQVRSNCQRGASVDGVQPRR
jgi:hypothetical protein